MQATAQSPIIRGSASNQNKIPKVTGTQVRNLFGGRIRPRTRPPRRARTVTQGPPSNMQEDEGFENSDEYDYDLLFGAVFLVFLIFVLSPGVLLTLPPGRGRVFMSGNTSTVAAFVHAVLIVLLLSLI
jgi:hypothetical protein